MGTRNYNLVSAAVVEAEEMRRIERRTERNISRRAVENAERRAWEAEREVARQKKAHRKMVEGMTASVGVFAGLFAATACVIAAPWWTALAPLALVVITMRKVGWL